MDISFHKKISQSRTKVVTVRVAVGISNGVLTPYLTASAFLSLVAFDSIYNYSNGVVSFYKLYHHFIKRHANTGFVVDTVDERPYFGPGKKKVSLLNSEGFRKFAFDYAYKFQLCPTNVKNFMDACLSKFACPGSIEKLPEYLRCRDLPNNISSLPFNELYLDILSGEVPSTSFILSSDFQELQRVLDSMNTFYIMELVDNRFRAGHSRVAFLRRLMGHTSYKSSAFIRFHCIYLFGESSFLDSATLENDFFLKAPLVLKKRKYEVERCNSTDYSFQVDDKGQIERMLELCLSNPRIQYGGLMDPFVNTKALRLLNAKCLPTVKACQWARNNNIKNDATFPQKI